MQKKAKEKFPDEIERSASELMRARGKKSSFWRYAYTIGVGGWLFVLPVVGGAYLGHYLDGKMKGGISWTITFIIIGIATGIYNVWLFYFRRQG
ncbi:MAG: AtpZ/AtpI family protein [Nitrospiraceae bacterium]|nr:AtpZ/AtpI family protein [Nitrospiraceae bacterium]